MSDRTAIEYVDATWNAMSGCTPVSAGCMHCYARRFAERMQRQGTMRKYKYGFAVTLHPDTLGEPMHWKKPRRVFVCSMGDLFHSAVPTSFINQVLETSAACPQHTFLLLTKRADRMAALLRPGVLPANAWAGVSVESQSTAWRIDRLRDVAAAIRFVSFEPLLGPVEKIDLSGIGWVIVGGETGLGSRVMRDAWVREIFDAAAASGIPFFFKQWGDADPFKRPATFMNYEWRQWPRRDT